MERLLLHGVAFLGESCEYPIEYFYKLGFVGLSMRSALTSALYRKALFLGTALHKDCHREHETHTNHVPVKSLREVGPSKRAFL